MFLWLLPNEIRPYHARTFTSMPSEIVKVQNCSLGCHFPKSAFKLWQVQLNDYIFFSQCSLIVLIMPHPIPVGIRHKVLALAYEGVQESAIAGHVGLTHATINCIPQRHVATGTLVPGMSTGNPRPVSDWDSFYLYTVGWQCQSHTTHHTDEIFSCCTPVLGTTQTPFMCIWSPSGYSIDKDTDSVFSDFELSKLHNL